MNYNTVKMKLLKRTTNANIACVKLLTLLPVVAATLSCDNDKKSVADVLECMQSQPVCLPLSDMQCRYRAADTSVVDTVKSEMRMVVYVDSAECSPCALDKMYHWNDLIDESRKWPGVLDFVFVVAPRPSQLEDVYLSIESSGLKRPVYVDTAYQFRKVNPAFPTDSKYHVFLLNNRDSIIMVGNPLNNSSIEKMLWRLVKAATSD